MRYVFALSFTCLFLFCALVAQPAKADFNLHLDGSVSYDRPHHWWTNDGRRANWEAASGRRDSHPREGTGSREDSSHGPKDGARGMPHWARSRDRSCGRLQALYVMRHPFNKPNSLRAYHGCALYRADAEYHSKLDWPDSTGPSAAQITYQLFDLIGVQ